MYEHVLGQYNLHRNKDWEGFRNKIIVERGNVCELSRATTDLEAHHILPFHFAVLLGYPQLELEPKNIIIVSGGPINVHLLVCHLDNFQSYNPYILNTKLWAKVAKSPNIQQNPFWNTAVKYRPPFWNDTDLKRKDRIKRWIDEVLLKRHV